MALRSIGGRAPPKCDGQQKSPDTWPRLFGATRRSVPYILSIAYGAPVVNNPNGGCRVYVRLLRGNDHLQTIAEDGGWHNQSVDQTIPDPPGGVVFPIG